MTIKFKSFEEFGQAAKEEQIKNLKQQINSTFEKSVKDDFDSIPIGSFKSSLPEIDSISFVHPDNNATGDILYAVIFSRDSNGKSISHSWAILRNGNIYPKDKIPLELGKYKEEELALEIVSLLERINPAFIHLTNLDVIPDQDEGRPREKSQDLIINYVPPVENPIDPEREQFLQSLRGAQFEFANSKSGFRGYKGFLFPNFVFLEKPIKDNAAFIMDLPERINVESVEEELARQNTGSGEEKREISKSELREAILERYWKPISEKAKTRQELTSLGAQRIIHTPDKWQENIRQAIASRAE